MPAEAPIPARSSNSSLVSYLLTVTAPQNGTVTSSDGYINCPGSCTHSYVENSQVTLTGNPAQGYQFSSWGGACTGSNLLHRNHEQQ